MLETEKQVEKALVRMIRSHGGTCLKFTSPGNTGVPDRLCLAAGVVPFFVELKRPQGGTISEKQRYWQNKLTSYGLRCFIVKNPEEIDGIERWLIEEMKQGAESIRNQVIDEMIEDLQAVFHECEYITEFLQQLKVEGRTE